MQPFLFSRQRRISQLGTWLEMVLLVLVAGAGIVRADEASDLTKFLPNDINALAIVRVEQIMQTPRAQQEEWAKAADQKFLSGAGTIPSWVRTLAVGFLTRPSVREELWAAGVASVPPAVTIESISLRDRVPVEQLNGISAVHSHRNTFVLGLAPGVLGIWRPAIRQEAARWALALEAKVTGPLSDYLVQAAQAPGHIVMAIDLENMLDPANTFAHLAMVPEIVKSEQLQSRLQSVVMSVRGATLSIHIQEKTTAQLRVEFGQDISGLGTHLQKFFLTSLHDLGAAIEDFDRGVYQTDDQALVLTTDLSDESLRRLMSLITSAPSSSAINPQQADTSPGTSPGTSPEMQVNAAASGKYFSQVDQFLEDLSKANRKATDYSRTALWHENFAAKIDELPTTGVDPAVVDYGSDVASKLRALGRSLRGQQLQVNLQQGTLTYDYDYNPGWASMSVWGGVGYGAPSYRVTSNLQEVRQRQAAAIAEGARQREDVWSMITENRLKVLRQMQQKYGADFGK